MIRKGKFLFILGIVLLSIGCYFDKNGTLHVGDKPVLTKIYSKEEMLNAFENLDCYYQRQGFYRNDIYYKKIIPNNKPEIECNLKNNYTVIDDIKYKDDNNYNARKLELRLKDYDVSFEVISTWGCSGTSDSTFGCHQEGYVIGTNYLDKAFDFFTEQYDLKVKNQVCNFKKDEICTINSEEDVKLVADYYENFKDYLNSLSVKFWQPFTLQGKISSHVPSLAVEIKEKNGIYTFIDYSGNEVDDLYSYLLNFYRENK